ncbi:tRNA(Ile)-lysidine synthase [Actinopolymorpha cephalotaxi]|uniref:tRNA(Ile)-lysidine synthase n=1 Tax=Actinopolymorpha cephalotaxi TaxID=504797 RepID=A0A1I2NFC3_9ACTN|nr:tRNA lysidine(34) synthetase TilS [Actinopolymorpha cephalotaxi]NYH85579.1 tRNA(Ile)-lysidine synthase [Actinopolymorpha cephalotaxi]SFG01760.1 tRNA(Ile)-lysidine synthase [Actinopolymorpha cephalotaxi]
MGPYPAVASVRLAVRRALADLPPGARVLVACSGGADSTALAAATAFEAARADWSAGGVTVDHGLQAGSAERAAAVEEFLLGLGLAPVETATVRVERAGGPEAAARRARYTALDEVADRHGAAAVLLGHTLDDQAETVLLGLARGSGTRSLAGMSPGGAMSRSGAGRYRRPLLGLTRATTEAACTAEGLRFWSDPHNTDPAYTRSRVRHQVLPVLERELGPGVAAALARTGDLLRDDADALDEAADEAYAKCRTPGPAAGAAAVVLEVEVLAALPAAIRRRVLRRAALAAGSPGTDLTAGHLAALDALVTDWHGQAWVEVPGDVRITRRDGEIRLRRER